MAGTGTDALFFAWDHGQRIFQQPFSWTQYGVDLRSQAEQVAGWIEQHRSDGLTPREFGIFNA